MAERIALVTGATGAIGPGVVRTLQASGYSVRTLSLDEPDAGVLPDGVDVRAGDVCDSQSVRTAIVGVDVVVHLAALLHQFDNIAGLEEEYERVNVGGTDKVVRAAVGASVRRIVLLSTIAVYGPTEGRLIDETTIPRPDTTYGKTKLEAERLVLSATTAGKPIGTVLRSAAVYGSRVKGNYRRLAVAVARRRYLPLGPGTNRRTVVHDCDLAKAIVLGANHTDAAGAVFNVSDGCVRTLSEIVAAIYSAIGRRPPRVHIPLGAVRAATRALEVMCAGFGVSPPLTSALLEKYTEDVAVDATLIKRAIGFTASVDLQEGWVETMTALAESGAISGSRLKRRQ